MTKTELRQYRVICEEIRQLEEEIDRIESPVMHPAGQQITDMPMAPHTNSDRIGDMVSQTEELRKMLYQKRRELLATRTAIEEAINSLEPVERVLCRHRYINGMQWEEVCCEMGYSWNSIHTIHRRALKKLREKE